MPIDPRSELGKRLDVERPEEVDLSRLAPAFGQEVVRFMEDEGVTRQDAFTTTVNRLGKFAGRNIIALDADALFGSHPEIQLAVDGLIESGLTRGKAVTRLLLDGVNHPDRKPHKDIGEMLRDMGATANPDGSFTVNSGDIQAPINVRKSDTLRRTMRKTDKS